MLSTENLDRVIVEAEEHFEAEKRDLLGCVPDFAAVQTRRRYLKVVEAQLADMHDVRREQAKVWVASD